MQRLIMYWSGISLAALVVSTVFSMTTLQLGWRRAITRWGVTLFLVALCFIGLWLMALSES